MQQFDSHQGVVAPLDRANVDTDLIIPKQFLKSIRRTGFGPNLFDSLRYLDEGAIGQDNDRRPRNPDFVLNKPEYSSASILLARENFGCGSSREHAPWALLDFGIRCVIAPSFADIFYNNSFKNGLLPIVLDDEEVAELFIAVKSAPGLELAVDLAAQTVIDNDNQRTYRFSIDEFRKNCLLDGLDEIGLTLKSSAAIKAFEARQRASSPWLYPEQSA